MAPDQRDYESTSLGPEPDHAEREGGRKRAEALAAIL